MAELLTLDLTAVSDEDVERWLAEMDSDSHRRVEAMSGPKRRRESVAGDHLARTALAKSCGKAPWEIVILRTENGKPYADEGCFSISHSGERVVCAVGEKPVGVDIERIRPAPARVAERYFSEEEKLLLQQDAATFWRIWTGKEALCKLSGEGIAGVKKYDTTVPPAGVELTHICAEGYVITVAEEKFDNSSERE